MIQGAGPWPGRLGAMDAGREKGKGVGWRRARKERVWETLLSLFYLNVLFSCFFMNENSFVSKLVCRAPWSFLKR